MAVAADPPALSVLIVEDQPDVAESLQVFLALAGGHDVSVAADGETGVDMAVTRPPDAVVCDIGLPKKDGFQVARELAARLPSTPLLIAFTGYSGLEGRAREAGFHHYFVKPADPVRLDALLQEHRAGRKAG
jgi:DNA-binding response OmpR family regulator